MFDMELTMGDTPCLASSDAHVNHFDPDLMTTVSEIEQCLRLKTDFERKLMQAYSGSRDVCFRSGHLDLHLLVERLKERQFVVMLAGEDGGRHGVGSRSPKHPFLLCFESVSSRAMKDPIVLDPNFKAQFDIQNPSETYSGILEAIPDAFIGRRARLEILVELLCCEMQRSFQTTQRAVPPWRGLHSMLAKWTVPSEVLREVGNAFVGSC